MLNSSRLFKASIIQMCASTDLEDDTRRCLDLMQRAADEGAQLITLPENCVGLDQRSSPATTISLPETQHPALAAFPQFARENHVEILIGSLGIQMQDQQFNRSYFIDKQGCIKAYYDKINLFDVDLGEGQWFRESDTFTAGERAVMTPCCGGKAGMAICYDVRFPQLFRAYAQAGADILFVPAAFTKTTGKAHWHALLRARAIENGAWVIAPAQHGTAEKGCYGHSLIVDPWGEIRVECGIAEEVATTEIDLALVTQARTRVPALRNEREFRLS